MPALPREPSSGVGRELGRAGLTVLGLTVGGVALGLLWLWLAPRVPLVSDGKAVYLKDSEGEQAIGMDGTFVLLGLAVGLVSGLVVFLLRRRGGVGVVVGLAVGGVLGSLVAWRLGIWLGPTQDVVAHAKDVGKDVTFDAPLELAAKGALLAWSLAACAVHLALTAAFGPRDPAPYPSGPWAGGPRWTTTGTAPQPHDAATPTTPEGDNPYAGPPPQQPHGPAQPGSGPQGFDDTP